MTAANPTGQRPTFSNAQKLKTFGPAAKNYLVRDTTLVGGYVEVTVAGNFSYQLRYSLAGTKRRLILGKFDPDPQSLSAMRNQAKAAQLLVAQKIDPANRKQEEKKQTKAALKKEAAGPEPDLVSTVVESFIRLHVLPNNKNHKETIRILNKDILPRWGKRRLSEITSSEVREAFRDIAKRAPVGGNRIYSHFRKMCNWACENEIIASSPCDRIKPMTSERGRSRERVLNNAEMATVYRAAGTLGFPFGPITQLLMLTGARRGEISGLRWSEIDLEAKVIRLPASRMKANVAHVIPLTGMALDILKSLPRFDRAKGQEDFVFSSGTTAPSGFSKWKSRLDKAIARSSKDQQIIDFTIHDIRRSCASHLAELQVNPAVIEKVLAHTSGTFGGVAGVYNRYAFEKEVRDALERLSALLASIAA